MPCACDLAKRQMPSSSVHAVATTPSWESPAVKNVLRDFSECVQKARLAWQEALADVLNGSFTKGCACFGRSLAEKPAMPPKKSLNATRPPHPPCPPRSATRGGPSKPEAGEPEPSEQKVLQNFLLFSVKKNDHSSTHLITGVEANAAKLTSIENVEALSSTRNPENPQIPNLLDLVFWDAPHLK